MNAFYNENDPVAAHVLSSLASENLIAPGRVDARSIKDVQSDDVAGFTQAHFFAGAGLWSVAARLAGWPDDKPLWTGSCPCQPFSVAGKGGGVDDPRHLWPDFFRLIRSCRPPCVVGEQVAGSAGEDWFDGVRSDLAGEGYEARVVVLPSLAVDAPNIRQRQFWVALADVIGSERDGRAVEQERRAQGRTAVGRHDAHGAPVVDTTSIGRGEGQPEPEFRGGRSTLASADASGVTLGDAVSPRLERHAGHDCGALGRQEPHRSITTADGGDVANADEPFGWIGDEQSAGQQSIDESNARTGVWAGSWHGRDGSFWSDHEWIICHDGKARRTKPGLRLLVDGMAGRIHLWRLAGNSINAVLAAEVLAALLDVRAA